MARIPYDDLGSMTTGGTWGGPASCGAPPLPPCAPGVYNGSIAIDAAGITPGDYTYTYTVTDGVATDIKTITYPVTTTTTVENDLCTGAETVAFPSAGGVVILTDQYNEERCPGHADPTTSGIAIPTEWGADTKAGDLWYKINYVPPTNGFEPISAIISVDGEPYGTSGMVEPMFAIYSDCSGTLVEASHGDDQLASLIISGVFDSAFTYYLRVCSRDVDKGTYNIKIVI